MYDFGLTAESDGMKQKKTKGTFENNQHVLVLSAMSKYYKGQ